MLLNLIREVRYFSTILAVFWYLAVTSGLVHTAFGPLHVGG